MTELTGTLNYAGELVLSNGRVIPLSGEVPRGPFKAVVRGEYAANGVFRVREYRLDSDSVRNWLTSLSPGIPARQAAWIAERLAAGEAVPTKIPGLSKEQARLVQAGLIRSFDEAKVLAHLQAQGISKEGAFAAFNQFGRDAITILHANPYLLATVPGVPFSDLDTVAARRGLPHDSMNRTRGAIIRETVRATFEQGHTGVAADAVRKRCRTLLSKVDAWGLNEYWVDDGHLDAAMRLRPAVADLDVALETRAYLRRAGQVHLTENAKVIFNKASYWSEIQAAQRVAALLATGETLPLRRPGAAPGDDQLAAIRLCCESPVAIIHGAPGTGKTWAAKEIIEAIATVRPNWTIRLAAPTGMAAQRLAQACGREASTVHRLLSMTASGMSPFSFERHPLRADVVLVDEASMLDLYLFRDLAWGLRNGARLILLGDPNQLPAVGPGNVLGDLLEAGVPSVKLTTIRRQGKGSAIPRVAETILNGSFAPDGNDVVVAPVEELWSLNPKETMILTAYRSEARSQFAADALNAQLQKQWNPGKGMFRVGDPIVQVRNLYLDDGDWIPNGERGIIEQVLLDPATDDVVSVAVYYPGLDRRQMYSGVDMFRNIELAYALTVHKAQGSEADQVAVVVGDGGRFWDRRLLYTAITRAKQRAIVLGNPDAVCEIAARSGVRRRTLLPKRMAAHMAKTSEAANT